MKNTKRPAGVLAFDEKHSTRVMLDACDVVYDRAIKNGLSPQQAAELASEAAQSARDNYYGR